MANSPGNFPRRRSQTREGKGRKPLRIAVCIDTRDHSGRERLQGMYEHALHADWHLMLMRQDDPNALNGLVEMHVDGAILSDRPRTFHEFFRERGIRCVEASARNLDMDDAAVFVDDMAVGGLVLDHLIEAGFEHLAYCGPSTEVNPVSRQRAASFCSHAERMALKVSLFDSTTKVGEAQPGALVRWLRKLPKPVGILTYDDRFGEQILSACHLANIAVPEQVGVVGVGDDDLICELVHPSLSSVGVPTREIGRRVAECLDAILCGRKPAKAHWAIPPSEVIVRGSSERISTSDRCVTEAIQIIRQTCHSPIGTDQIAAKLGVSRRKLERRFVAEMGKTVHDYLTTARLGRAKLMLRRSRFSIEEVSRQCGYMSLSTLTRAFQLREGCKPLEYRQKHGRA